MIPYDPMRTDGVKQLLGLCFEEEKKTTTTV